MDKIKDKGAIIICAIAIILIIVLLVVKGGNKNQEENATQNLTTQNTVTQETTNSVVEEFVETKSDGSKVNTSEELKKTKTIDGLEISNIRLVESGGLSQIVADIKNNTSETKGDFDVVITMLDKNGNKIGELDGFIDKVSAGKTAELNASVTSDIANAYNFTIEKK